MLKQDMLKAPGNEPSSVEIQDPSVAVKNFMSAYADTFESTNFSDIVQAERWEGMGAAQATPFRLEVNTFVTHQGLTIFSLGEGDTCYITKNPLIVSKLKEAGCQEDKNQGTPLANVDIATAKKNMPYLANFLISPKAKQENDILNSQRKSEALDREAKFLTDESFQKTFGFSKEDFNSNRNNDKFLEDVRI